MQNFKIFSKKTSGSKKKSKTYSNKYKRKQKISKNNKE